MAALGGHNNTLSLLREFSEIKGTHEAFDWAAMG